MVQLSMLDAALQWLWPDAYYNMILAEDDTEAAKPIIKVPNPNLNPNPNTEAQPIMKVLEECDDEAGGNASKTAIRTADDSLRDPEV